MELTKKNIAKLSLVHKVDKHKDILFGKRANGTNGRKIKEDQWKAIREELIMEGYTEFGLRSWKNMRDVVWATIKTRTVAKIKNSDLTSFNEIEELVSKMINFENNMDESVQMNIAASDEPTNILSQSSDSSSNSRTELNTKIHKTFNQQKQIKMEICKLNLEVKLLELEIMKKKLRYAKILG